LKVRNNRLEGNDLADKAAGNVFDLFWEVIVLPAKEVLFYF